MNWIAVALLLSLWFYFFWFLAFSFPKYIVIWWLRIVSANVSEMIKYIRCQNHKLSRNTERHRRFFGCWKKLRIAERYTLFRLLRRIPWLKRMLLILGMFLWNSLSIHNFWFYRYLDHLVGSRVDILTE